MVPVGCRQGKFGNVIDKTQWKRRSMTGRFEYPLEDTQIEAFDRDGAIHLRSVIDDKWVGRAREACARAAAVETVEGSRGPTYFMRLRLWERDEVFKHFCNTPSITGVARGIRKPLARRSA